MSLELVEGIDGALCLVGVPGYLDRARPRKTVKAEGLTCVVMLTASLSRHILSLSYVPRGARGWQDK
jgi:hypothetical protein